MASARRYLALICLLAANAAPAARLASVRLPFDMRGLEAGHEVSYHPNRWLTIRRSIGLIRLEPVDDRVGVAPVSVLPRSGPNAMTGDVHPFGDALRLSFGVREDGNGRLLRGSNDRADIGTARYAPLLSVGLAGEVAEGLRIGGDVGLLGRDTLSTAGAVLVTPVERLQARRDEGRGYRPMLSLSAGYRF